MDDCITITAILTDKALSLMKFDDEEVNTDIRKKLDSIKSNYFENDYVFEISSRYYILEALINLSAYYNINII